MNGHFSELLKEPKKNVIYESFDVARTLNHDTKFKLQEYLVL